MLTFNAKPVFQDFKTMTLKMTYDTFRADSLGLRWEWEKTQCLRLGLMDTYARSLEGALVEGIQSIVAEFQLPLQIELASQQTVNLIERLLSKCSLGTTIDCGRFLQILNHNRPGEPTLQAGLVIAFDGRQRSLYDESSLKPEEPPTWGWTQEDGLILLRLEPEEPLRNVIRHELGHLLGIGHHYSDCVMAWDCTQEGFCQECKRTIRETCQVIG